MAEGSVMGDSLQSLSELLLQCGQLDADEGRVRRRLVTSEIAKYVADAMARGRDAEIEQEVRDLPLDVRDQTLEALADISLTVPGFFVGEDGPVARRLVLCGMLIEVSSSVSGRRVPEERLVEIFREADLPSGVSLGACTVLLDVASIPKSLTGLWRWTRSFARAMAGDPLKLRGVGSIDVDPEEGVAHCLCLIAEESGLRRLNDQPGSFWVGLGKALFGPGVASVRAPVRLDRVREG